MSDARYVLVVVGEGLAFGPFPSRDDAEYAAMDYYGTAITGASAKGEFLVAELRSGSGMVDRHREAHVRAILATDA